MPVARLSVTPKLNAAKKIESSKKRRRKNTLQLPIPLLVIVVYLKIGKAK